MASKVEEFIGAPSDDLLNDLTKDELLELANHYEINLMSQDKRLKDNIKTLIKTKLIECRILESQSAENASAFVNETSTMFRLTFEQQKTIVLNSG